MDENIREEILQENKMGTMPVGRLLFSMAVPMMVSMLFQALYNVVDSIFVAKLSQDAMNAVSLAFPLQTLCIAFSGGTGVGMNALLSRSLGGRGPRGECGTVFDAVQFCALRPHRRDACWTVLPLSDGQPADHHLRARLCDRLHWLLGRPVLPDV